jgi:hypothetical protein
LCQLILEVLPRSCPFFSNAASGFLSVTRQLPSHAPCVTDFFTCNMIACILTSHCSPSFCDSPRGPHKFTLASSPVPHTDAAFPQSYCRRRRKSSLARRRRRQRYMSRVRWRLHLQQQASSPPPKREPWKCALCSYTNRIDGFLRARSRSTAPQNQTYRSTQYSEQGALSRIRAKEISHRGFFRSTHRSCWKQLRLISSRQRLFHRWPWSAQFIRRRRNKTQESSSQGGRDGVEKYGFRPENSRQRGQHAVTITITSIIVYFCSAIRRITGYTPTSRDPEIKFSCLEANLEIPGQSHDRKEISFRKEEAGFFRRPFRF